MKESDDTILMYCVDLSYNYCVMNVSVFLDYGFCHINRKKKRFGRSNALLIHDIRAPDIVDIKLDPQLLTPTHRRSRWAASLPLLWLSRVFSCLGY